MVSRVKKWKVVGTTVVVSDSSKCTKRERSGDNSMVRRVLRTGSCRIIRAVLLPSSEGVLTSRVTHVTSRKVTRLVMAANKAKFSPESYVPRTAGSVVRHRIPKVPRTVETCDVAVAPETVLDHTTTNVQGKALVIGLPKDPGTIERDLRCVVPTLRRKLRVLAKRTAGYTEGWSRGTS